VRIEALFLTLIAAYLIIRSLTSELEETDAVIAEVVYLIAAASGLFIAGRGFLTGRYYGRGATVLANLIALGLAYYMIDGGRILWGLILGIFAGATLIAAIVAIPQGKGERT
jgi:hypothetical protein